MPKPTTDQDLKTYTIGYEGRSLKNFTSTLLAANVDLLLDTRYWSQSRKKGFSKSSLAKSLKVSKIDYLHIRELGTPPRLLEQMKKFGGYSLDEYAEHLDKNIHVIHETADKVAGKVVAVMCYEKDASVCHRSVVAKELSKDLGSIVGDL